MKKSFIASIIVTLFVFAGSLQAQKQLYFGLAGTGLSSVITNQNNYGLPFEMDYAVTFGGSGNVNVGFDFNKNLGLKLEIGFAKLGQKYADTRMENDTNYKYARNIKLNYLQIPLMFKYQSNGEVARFYFMVGPQFNFLLSAKQVYTKQDLSYDDYITVANKPVKIGEETITDRFNSFHVMARFDLGVDIHVATNLFLNVGLTMAYGLTDINATDWQNPLKNTDYDYNPSHNIYGGVNFGINYMLPIGGK